MAFYRIGGLWLKRDKKNRQYLTGAVDIDREKLQISTYKNEKKVEKNQPDWLIYEQKIDKKFQK